MLGRTDRFAREQAQRYRKRPEYELYDLDADPYELPNLVGEPRMQRTFDRLLAPLRRWMASQGDKGRATEEDAKSRQPEPWLTE